MRKSTGEKLVGKAERQLALYEGQKAKGIPIELAAERLTVNGALDIVLDDYRVNGQRSLKSAEQKMKHLRRHLGHHLLVTITARILTHYISTRKAETKVVRPAYVIERKDGIVIPVPETTRETNGPTNAQLNRELTLLRRGYALAQKNGLHYRAPITLLKESNVRSGFFDDDQIAAVIRALPEALRPVVRFAYITGWRVPSEVLPLTWAQIDFAAGELRLEPGTTKNGEGGTFPMTAELRALLVAQRAGRDELRKAGHLVPWVFWRMVGKRGGKAEKEPRQVVAFSKAWKKACKQAGLPGRIVHDLRRSAIRNLVRARVPEGVAMKLTGHRTRSVFDRYNTTGESDLRLAVQLLDARAAITETGKIAQRG